MATVGDGHPRATKRGWIVLGIVLVLLLGGGTWFAISTLNDDDSTPERTAAGSGGFVDPPEEEAFGDVHFRFEIETDERTLAKVYFVADGSEDELLAAAVDCVAYYTEGQADKDYSGASCYGFDDEEALDFAEPDVETGAMANLCWRAYFSSAGRVEDGTGRKAGAQYEKEGCP